MLIRLKHRQGQTVISNLTCDSTVADLLEAVHQVLPTITTQDTSLRVGFPPKPIDTLSIAGLALSLKQASITSGETVIVEEKPRRNVPLETSPLLVDQLSDYSHEAGCMIRKIIPSDNSCLFTAVHFSISGLLDTSNAPSMRELVASIVISDTVTYNEGILGMPNTDYVEWILDPNHWGGGIEVALLSKAYNVEIAVVDTQTTRVDRFGEVENYPERIMLIYDGIHYDSLAWESGHTGKLITRFSIDDDKTLLKALELACEAKASRQYTDTARFTLKCNDCGLQLIGSKEAQEHASQTGHINFGET